MGSRLKFDCHVYDKRGGAGAEVGHCGYFITKACRLDRTCDKTGESGYSVTVILTGSVQERRSRTSSVSGGERREDRRRRFPREKVLEGGMLSF